MEMNGDWSWSEAYGSPRLRVTGSFWQHIMAVEPRRGQGSEEKDTINLPGLKNIRIHANQPQLEVNPRQARNPLPPQRHAKDLYPTPTTRIRTQQSLCYESSIDQSPRLFHVHSSTSALIVSRVDFQQVVLAPRLGFG